MTTSSPAIGRARGKARSILSFLATGLFALCILGITAAGAQEMYDWSEPAPDAVLKTSPETMKIVFLTGIYLQDVRLYAADQSEWPVEWAKTEGNVFDVAIRVPKALPPGRYDLKWSAYIRQHRHDDGGTINFTIAP